MKKIKRILGIALFGAFLLISEVAYSQSQSDRSNYNTALGKYNNRDYAGAINILNSYMNAIQDNPGGYVNAGEGYVVFVFKVYRLAASCYYYSGDSGSSDVIVDNLVYVLSDFYYESDIIDTYNNTSIGPY